MTTTRYEQDFYSWLCTQATLLRAKQWEGLDIDNLAEELDTLGRSERRAVASYLRRLLLHLLKWAHQPARRSRSWRVSILRAREGLAERIEESPSLRRDLPSLLARAYARARHETAEETGLPETTFPEICPWRLDQLQDPTFLPAEDRPSDTP